MEEYIYTIRAYLPVEFEEQETNEFIDYLVSAYLENLQNKKFQFSFTSFHMLYMSYIYKTKWFLNKNGVKSVEALIAGYPKQDKYKNSHFNTLFDLSIISEAQSLSDLLNSLAFHNSVIANTKHFVTVRNNCSHAVGKILYKRDKQVENYILEELENIEAIHKKVKPQINIIFEKFIEETYDKSWIESELKEWIINKYLSQKDIEEILLLKPTFLRQNSDNKEIVFKKILYSVLVSELLKYLDNKGDYFTKSLNALMKGLTPQIDIRKNPADAERMKNTQVLIEEKIVPILATLSNEEAIEAQEILKLNIAE